MNRLVGIFVTLTLLGTGARTGHAEEEPASCTTHCHGAESTAFRESVHAKTLACTDCHGGDPQGQRDKDLSHSVDAGWRGRIARDDIPGLCGDCHADPARMHRYGLRSDQSAQYAMSAHGRAVLERGDLSAAVCTDCHGVHAVRPANDPRSPSAPRNQPATCGRCHADVAVMKPYGLSTDVVAQFVESVHGHALLQEHARGAPTCSSCHGSHAAVPPEVDGVVDACGQCHANTRDHYRQGPHYGEEDMRCRACHDEPGADFERSGCAACHGAHDIAHAGVWLYSGEQPGRCDHCHRDGEAKVETVRRTILDGRQAVEDGMIETMQLLEQGKDKGLFLENEALYVRESALTLISYRPIAHSLDAGEIARHLDKGLKRQDGARADLEKARAALRDRRIVILGLVFILLLLASLMAVKLRAIRRLS